MKYRFLRFPGHKTKAVTYSFDDGFRYDVKLLEIMNANGIRGTFNLVGNSILNGNPEKMITAGELHEIYDNGGHEIANHGFNHRALINLDTPEGMMEILKGRETLESALNRIVRGFVYPDRSSYNVEVCNMVRMSGAAYARGGPGTKKFGFPDDFYFWNPTCKFLDPDAIELANKFLKEDPRSKYCANRDSLLFYTWGHSFECPLDDWKRITELSEKLGNNDEIWYATNIEIHDYYMAYKSLQTSIDNKILYNPSTIKLWLDWDDERIVMEPGETKCL